MMACLCSSGGLLFGCGALLALLLAHRRAGVFAQVHHQPGPALLLVPFEAGQVGLIELVIGLL